MASRSSGVNDFIAVPPFLGHQAALTAGFQKASGEAVVTMDCDFQDPPELIPAMVQKWRDGNKIVYARRTARHDTLFKRLTAGVYYKILDSVSEVEIPRQVGDFRLMDRLVCDNLIRLGEHARYLRGMVAWLGFRHDFVDFERPDRLHGETHYPLKKNAQTGDGRLVEFYFFTPQTGSLDRRPVHTDFLLFFRVYALGRLGRHPLSLI